MVFSLPSGDSAAKGSQIVALWTLPPDEGHNSQYDFQCETDTFKGLPKSELNLEGAKEF